MEMQPTVLRKRRSEQQVATTREASDDMRECIGLPRLVTQALHTVPDGAGYNRAGVIALELTEEAT